MQLSNGCHINRDKFHRAVRPYDVAIHRLRCMPEVSFQTEQDRAQWWQFLSSKVHPRRGQEVPEGQYRYRCTLSLTSALGGCAWSTPRPGRFIPGKDRVPIVQENGSAPKRSRRMWKILPHLDSIPGPVASGYTDCAIPVHFLPSLLTK